MGWLANAFTWWNGATWGTAILSRRRGREVGRDDSGNVYFVDRKNPARRWVIYAGANDGSRVPPDWQLWLRGSIDGSAVQGASAGPQVPGQADPQSHRHDGGLPARRIARLEQDPARLDRRLRALGSRMSDGARPPWLAAVGSARPCARAAATAARAGCCSRRQKRRPRRQRGARQAGVTPMAERVAVLGVLNKRNGIVRDVALRPGQSARWKDMIVRLRACEKTAPWEQEQLTGAFVQVDVQRPDDSWGRVFSGWVYRESPSLNVVEHPVYDVWVKNCEMTFPAGAPAPRRRRREQVVERPELGRRQRRPAADRSGRAARPPTAAADRGGQQRRIIGAGHADRAERGEMRGHDLAVEQGEMAGLEPRHQPRHARPSRRRARCENMLSPKKARPSLTP